MQQNVGRNPETSQAVACDIYQRVSGLAVPHVYHCKLRDAAYKKTVIHVALFHHYICCFSASAP